MSLTNKFIFVYQPSSLSGTGPSIYGAGPSATGRLMRVGAKGAGIVFITRVFLQPSFTFPSPYHSNLSSKYRPISSTYSRHSQLGYVPLSQTGSGPQNFYHHTPTYYQVMVLHVVVDAIFSPSFQCSS